MVAGRTIGRRRAHRPIGELRQHDDHTQRTGLFDQDVYTTRDKLLLTPVRSLPYFRDL
jgi:hypothetical protein